MNTDRQIILIADNIRSLHNVGSIFRTADAFAVEAIYFTGVSPTPKRKNDSRLPHVIAKATKVIEKVALGAEKNVNFEHFETTEAAITAAKEQNFYIAAIEQAEDSANLYSHKFIQDKVAIVIGTEVTGLTKQIIESCDKTIELPMLGKKESLNASIMTGIALFAARS